MSDNQNATTDSSTKYGTMIEDHEWSEPEADVDVEERTSVTNHEIDVIYVTDPGEHNGYGREKYTASVSYDGETDAPFVLRVVEHRWKGNYWRDTTDWDWRDVPEPVRKQVAAVLPVDGPEALDSGTRIFDDGGESRWEKIHKPRIEAMGDGDEKTLCVECGVDLSDPKNAGDPDSDGEWVCDDPQCRTVHETEMTVGREVLKR